MKKKTSTLFFPVIFLDKKNPYFTLWRIKYLVDLFYLKSKM